MQKWLKGLVLGLALTLTMGLPVQGGTLLPNALQQFNDTNGVPYAGGSVYFYTAGTLTPKNTWTDTNQTSLNTNPVVLDSAGRAQIYGQGTYRQILKDSSGNTIWDKVTTDVSAFNQVNSGLTSGGSANVQTLTYTPAPAALTTGQVFIFNAGFSNSGATTLNVNGLGAKNVFKVASAGPIALVGGEIVLNNAVAVVYDGTEFQLIGAPVNLSSISNTVTMSGAAFNEASVTVASATTMNIGAAAGNYVLVTGTTTVTGFDTVQSGTERTLKFQSSLLMTNSASLILPGAADIVFLPGDVLTVRSEGAGVWRASNLLRANGTGALPGQFTNLKITVTSNTALTVSANTISLGDGTNHAISVNSPSLTINTGTSGANGIDTGSIANSTWYSVWVISNGTTVSGLITAGLSPTLPTGYFFKARVGWVRTDGSAALYRTLQQGRKAQYVVTAATNTTTIPVLGSGSSGSPTVPTWTAVSVSGWVPSTAASVGVRIDNGGANSGEVIAAPNNAYGGYAGSAGLVTNPPRLIVAGNSNTVNALLAMEGWFVLESTNIYWASGTASGQLDCIGWEDNL